MDKEFPPFAFGVQRVFDSVFFIEEAVIIDEKEVKVIYGLGIYTNIQESFIQYNVKGEFSFNGQPFASNTVVTKFSVVDLTAYTDKDGGIFWPENTLETMFGIAFNHLRALMSKNMAGSKFSHYVLPLINPKEVFNNLVVNIPEFSRKEVEKK